jgi:hypothetical protein
MQLQAKQWSFTPLLAFAAILFLLLSTCGGAWWLLTGGARAHGSDEIEVRVDPTLDPMGAWPMGRTTYEHRAHDPESWHAVEAELDGQAIELRILRHWTDVTNTLEFRFDRDSDGTWSAMGDARTAPDHGGPTTRWGPLRGTVRSSRALDDVLRHPETEWIVAYDFTAWVAGSDERLRAKVLVPGGTLR